MALVRQAQYDVQYDGENGTEKVEAFVDTSTGQIFNNVMGGNSESGFTHTMVPTEKMWDNPNTLDLSGRYIYGSQGYVPQGWRQDDDASTWGSFGTAGASPAGAQIGQFMASPTAKLVSGDKHTQEQGLDGQVLYRAPDLDDHHGIGQAWILPDIQKTNAYNPQGLVFYGSPETGFSVARTTEDDGTKGDNIRDMGNMLDANGIPIYGKRGRSDDSDGAQIGGSIATNPNYANALARAGITPRYDPEWGWVVSGTEFNRANDIYMQSIGGGIYGDKGGWINQMLDAGVPLQLMMGAIAGPAMGALSDAAVSGLGLADAGVAGATSGLQTTGMLPEVASTVDAGLATAETAALAGDAFLPGALSNPFLQAMPTVSSMAQSAATNAAMQLATTGTIDPEKIFTSVITGAIGSTAGNLAGNAAANALDSNLVRSVVSGAVSGATQAGINGTDPMAAALASGAASGLGYAGKLNGIDIPQKAINAVVSSVATGAPLENTLLNAAISIGIGAAKDAVSNISLTDTQAPAPVETRIPISPLPADSGNVTTAELSDTSPSGYVIAGTEVPANADGSIYSGLSATGSGINVATGETGTKTDITAGLISTDNFLDPSLPGFRYPVTQAEIDAYISYGSQNNPSFIAITGGEAQSGDVLLENDNEVLEGTGNNNTSIVADTTEENIANTGALSSIDVANINNNTLTAADTKTAVGFNDYSDIVYQTADGIFVDSSNNPVAAPSTKLDGTPFSDTLTGSATGAANTVVGGLSSVAGVDGAGSILDGSSTVDGTITGGQGRTGADATFIDGDGNVVDGSGNLVTGGHNDTLVGGVTTDPVSTVDGTPSSSVQTLPEVVVTPDDEEPTPPPEVDWEPYVNSPDTNAPPTTTLVTPAVTTTVGGGGLPTTTTPAAAAGVAGTLPDVNRLLADDSTKYPSPIKPYLQPNWITTGSPSQSSLWTGLDPKLVNILSRSMANGGQVHPQLQRILADRGYEMNPVEMVAGPEDRYYARHAKRGFAVNGPGTGQSDDIPTMLADSEYVIDADTVAALGDGSSKAGAEVLDKMRMAIRKHKRSAPINKIPPKAKSPLDYITEGMKMNAKKK